MKSQAFIDQWNTRLKRIQLHGTGTDNNGEFLLVSFPSYSNENKRNLTQYYLHCEGNDFCVCESRKRCWHLKFRPIILKLFRDRDPQDEDWLSKFELFRSGSVDEIVFYIEALFDQQTEVSQADLIELEIRDSDDNHIDRRIIGAAFLKLQSTGGYQKLYQKSAQYAKRKGGKVWVWGKLNRPRPPE